MDLSLAVKKGEAPGVLGIGRRSFEKHIFPLVKSYPMGNTVLIDRNDLNEAWKKYKQSSSEKVTKRCQKKATILTRMGTTGLTSNTSASEFTRQLDIARAKKAKSKLT